ncbi:Ribosomal large subunit pseudouridine synthase D [Roseisalinus antarcticus]|uniref:Pseudouridine synthase n=1 Tax=Roseisalinus antarcticus TaxID=254357 RepID=A0A1Y5SR99_9RHOB|nr:Ribosomal large subunit pseudouridine synthase D [Roseisalinus antarcticus]
MRVNGVIVTDLKARVGVGDAVEIALDMAEPSHMGAEAIPLDIRHEDAEIIVVNKAAGMVVHPAPGTPDGTLVNALIHHCGESLSGVGGERRPGIVHRIDKDTTGLLVAAKTDRAHHGLQLQFEAHTAERRYLALCFGLPDPGDPRIRGVRGTSFEPGGVLKIQTELARHKTDRQRQAVVWSGGRHATTRARVLEPFGAPPVAALLECQLETGRTHQIRVHMAHVGHGLIGDPVYGGRRKLSRTATSQAARDAVAAFPRQALHAATLGFRHPVTGEMLKFVAEMPQDMQELCDILRV